MHLEDYTTTNHLSAYLPACTKPQQIHEEVSATESIRHNLAIERMIIGGCDILLDVSQGKLALAHTSEHFTSPFSRSLPLTDTNSANSSLTVPRQPSVRPSGRVDAGGEGHRRWQWRRRRRPEAVVEQQDATSQFLGPATGHQCFMRRLVHPVLRHYEHRQPLAASATSARATGHRVHGLCRKCQLFGERVRQWQDTSG